MKKKSTYVLIAAAFVLVLVAASFGYRHLSEQYMPGNPFGDSSNKAPDRETDAPSPGDASAQGSLSAGDTSHQGNPSAGDTDAQQNLSAGADISTGSNNAENESETEEIIMAPDFTVLDMDGEEVSLFDFLGKPIVINFWATWCGPCMYEMPGFEEMYQEYGEDVEFMMVNLTDGSRDTVDGVKEFITENEYTFPVYFDTEYDAAYTYGTYSIPVTVFIDENGVLEAGQIGAMASSVLESYITELIDH